MQADADNAGMIWTSVLAQRSVALRRLYLRVRAADDRVTSVQAKGVRAILKVSCCFKRWASRCNHKYREVPRDDAAR